MLRWGGLLLGVVLFMFDFLQTAGKYIYIAILSIIWEQEVKYAYINCGMCIRLLYLAKLL